MNYLLVFICIIIGYLFGSIPTGYLYAKYKGINILEFGSKNPGSTNIGRALGKNASYTVFLMDLFKVITPIVLLNVIYMILNKHNFNIHLYIDANYLSNVELDILNSKLITIWTGMGAVLGHSYPIFLHFIGGKGISCTMATMLCISPIYAVILFMIYKITTKLTKYVSMGSITALTVLLLSSILLSISHIYPYDFYKSNLLLPAIIIIYVLCIYRHKDNIIRLINKTESKISIDNGTEI